METKFKPEPIKQEVEAGYIKLMKNETSKGIISYAWDIKMVEGKDPEPLKQMVLDIQIINDQMARQFTRDSLE